MKIADAMPEDKFSYKSTPAQRNYGEQILHVASMNVTVLKDVGTAPPPTINMNPCHEVQHGRASAGVEGRDDRVVGRR